VFIGPTSSTIASMGNKLEARALARKAGVPVIPGSPGPVATLEEAKAEAERIGCDHAQGGGGRRQGMRQVAVGSSTDPLTGGRPLRVCRLTSTWRSTSSAPSHRDPGHGDAGVMSCTCERECSPALRPESGGGIPRSG
jgi:hypothetical protein